MTQADRVLAMLRRAGADGLCSRELYRGDEHGPLPNGRNRIAVELRDRGFLIARGPCRDHDHGEAGYYRYVIEHDPERVPQQQLLGILPDGRSSRLERASGDGPVVSTPPAPRSESAGASWWVGE